MANESPIDPVTSQTFEQSFAEIEVCLEAFIAKAPVSDPEMLRDALDSVPPEYSRLALVEMMKVDMYAAAGKGSFRPIQWYLAIFKDLLPRDKVPLDLVMEEIQLRRESDQSLSLSEYQQSYPHLAGSLANVLTASNTMARVGDLRRPPELVSGDRLDDFTILSELGRGAFANVYLARQESMQRLVALKVSGRGDEEPQTLAQLDHPNVVRVYDQRTAGKPPLSLLYMQYVPGGTIAQVIPLVRESSLRSIQGQLLLSVIDRSLLAAGQPPPENSVIRKQLQTMHWPTAVAWIGMQLAEGLDYAHHRGVLHRDIKPANILLSADGVPRLADFNVSYNGIAGRAGASTHFGGSLAYMSPEQLRAADVADSFQAEELDSRSDLYSLGIVLWELWQGVRPWKCNNIVESWHHAIELQQEYRQRKLDTPHRLGDAAERVLESTLIALLQVDREQRPASGSELAGRLRLALHPEAAKHFHPDPDSLTAKILKIPVVVVCAATVLVPNALAGFLNFQYNRSQIVASYPELLSNFDTLSTLVNCTAFPLGFILIVYFAWPVVKAMREIPEKSKLTSNRLWATVSLGHRTAIFGGLFWLIAGLVFPFVMRIYSNEFSLSDSAHFFMSMLLFGGIAWIYPFFGITLIAVHAYYPRLLSQVMSDPDFHARRLLLRRQTSYYLLSAALVPLLALALLILRPGATQLILLTVILLTAIGSVASFFAHQKINETFRQLAKILAPDGVIAN